MPSKTLTLLRDTVIINTRQTTELQNYGLSVLSSLTADSNYRVCHARGKSKQVFVTPADFHFFYAYSRNQYVLSLNFHNLGSVNMQKPAALEVQRNITCIREMKMHMVPLHITHSSRVHLRKQEIDRQYHCRLHYSQCFENATKKQTKAIII